ncbi:MAG TPA: M20/M25/M40 family metallo-hydrolase [Kofleriaceae bacterium]|nr:M20/M25/M40 family metallo-hydrolase [Kofleriaceae bacterium]
MGRAVLAVVLVACGQPSRVTIEETPPSSVARVVPRVDAAVPAPCADEAAPYDEAALRARLAILASKDLDGRVPGTAGDTAARAYITERFRCLGIAEAGTTGYEQPFDAAGHATANLVGTIAGTTDDIVLIGAHFDHLGNGKLGANDNASGVVAMLAIAQAMHQQGVKPRRTVAFVAFGGEELGELGSRYFVAHPPAAIALDHIVYDINLDMLGSYKSHDFVAAMGTYPKMPARAIMDRLVDPKLHVGLGGRGADSDHEAFCKRGIPYVFFWTPDAACYHATCDTVDHVDLPHYAKIAALAGALVAELAETEVDLAAARRRLGCTGR